MEQITQVGAVACAYVTTRFDLLTDTRQLVSLVAIEEMDPGLVYIGWLRSYGLTISELSINYAQYLRREPLSNSQYLAHQRRVSHLIRTELQRQKFQHYTEPESKDTDSGVLLNDAAAEHDVNGVDGDEWLLVCPVEDQSELDDEVLDELEAQMGGMGLAM